MNDNSHYMTEDEAEEIIFANEVGRFFGSHSDLMYAHLLLAARNKKYEEENARLEGKEDAT
jgi:hypothetical protein